jgi:predicted nucleic acid-binding protein
MIAIDANILVYSFDDSDSAKRDLAMKFLTRLRDENRTPR